ncbi:uncharacterized protein BT62DRAFT_1014303 [Guyanagaster necrorhizus]|uniref:Uncharacterized protein n=1 Tax=Guyanagaster necrorhizus TaxID=856835 RepID=A0A9P7VEY0_9AGAR|nr:uncharacterized protein BT62DRAFT_1014303 [Guyanagaster necrorhizus MCA 3950]KAG7439155.1 hypothetical protein BT62DRAFT_1014303 [Guyanagaster necrorhizus MCA 3950]
MNPDPFIGDIRSKSMINSYPSHHVTKIACARMKSSAKELYNAGQINLHMDTRHELASPVPYISPTGRSLGIDTAASNWTRANPRIHKAMPRLLSQKAQTQRCGSHIKIVSELEGPIQHDSPHPARYQYQLFLRETDAPFYTSREAIFGGGGSAFNDVCLFVTVIRGSKPAPTAKFKA